MHTVTETSVVAAEAEHFAGRCSCLRKSTTSIRGKIAGALQAAYQRGVDARGVATCLCLGAGHGKQCCSGDGTCVTLSDAGPLAALRRLAVR